MQNTDLFSNLFNFLDKLVYGGVTPEEKEQELISMRKSLTSFKNWLEATNYHDETTPWHELGPEAHERFNVFLHCFSAIKDIFPDPKSYFHNPLYCSIHTVRHDGSKFWEVYDLLVMKEYYDYWLKSKEDGLNAFFFPIGKPVITEEMQKGIEAYKRYAQYEIQFWDNIFLGGTKSSWYLSILIPYTQTNFFMVVIEIINLIF